MTQVLWLDEEHILSDVSSNLAAGASRQLPQQASPDPSFATEVKENSVCLLFLLLEPVARNMFVVLPFSGFA